MTNTTAQLSATTTNSDACARADGALAGGKANILRYSIKNSMAIGAGIWHLLPITAAVVCLGIGCHEQRLAADKHIYWQDLTLLDAMPETTGEQGDDVAEVELAIAHRLQALNASALDRFSQTFYDLQPTLPQINKRTFALSKSGIQLTEALSYSGQSWHIICFDSTRTSSAGGYVACYIGSTTLKEPPVMGEVLFAVDTLATYIPIETKKFCQPAVIDALRDGDRPEIVLAVVKAIIPTTAKSDGLTLLRMIRWQAPFMRSTGNIRVSFSRNMNMLRRDTAADEIGIAVDVLLTDNGKNMAFVQTRTIRNGLVESGSYKANKVGNAWNAAKMN